MLLPQAALNAAELNCPSRHLTARPGWRSGMLANARLVESAWRSCWIQHSIFTRRRDRQRDGWMATVPPPPRQLTSALSCCTTIHDIVLERIAIVGTPTPFVALASLLHPSIRLHDFSRSQFVSAQPRTAQLKPASADKALGTFARIDSTPHTTQSLRHARRVSELS